MHSTIARSLTTALALSAAGVLSLGAQQDQSSSAAGTLALPRYTAAPIGVSETELLRRMSDANILGHLATMDSVEIDLSEWTAGLSKSDAVTAYAKQMDATYRNKLNRDHQLGQETGIGLTTMAGELKRSHIGPAVDSVRNASDASLDRHYMLSQVQFHEHMLGELAILQSTAQHPKIREHIAAQIPILQDELSRARAIAVSKGYISSKAK
jgi:predicted outer membrane protein